MAQHEQKRQQAELFYTGSNEVKRGQWPDYGTDLWLVIDLGSREPFAYGPAEGEVVETCPACGEEPMTCDCDTRAMWGGE